MTIAEFNAQMKRLSDTFGAQHYKQERLNLVWKEVQFFGVARMAMIVDEMLGAFRQAPLPADFAEAAARVREREWQHEKRRMGDDAKEFWSGQHYGDDDRKMIFDTFIRRMKTNVELRTLELAATTEERRAALAERRAKEDQAWNAFLEMLKTTRRSA